MELILALPCRKFRNSNDAAAGDWLAHARFASSGRVHESAEDRLDFRISANDEHQPSVTGVKGGADRSTQLEAVAGVPRVVSSATQLS